MTIYIIFGATGEYSDHRRWIVKACASEDQATKFVDKINKWLVKNDFHYDRNNRGTWENDYERRHDAVCPLDPKFHCDYTGTEYYYEPCELEE
jgi:hypothetical protein